MWLSDPRAALGNLTRAENWIARLPTFQFKGACNASKARLARYRGAIGLTVLASALLGLNREAHGHSAGFTTTILVGLADALTMLQANILPALGRKDPGSFASWMCCAFRSPCRRRRLHRRRRHPSPIGLHRSPARIVKIVPACETYEYFLLADGRIVIVDPCLTEPYHPAKNKKAEQTTCTSQLDAPEYNQNDDYKQHKTEATAAIVARAVERPATEPAKAAKQCENQNDDKDGAETHSFLLFAGFISGAAGRRRMRI